MGKREMYARGYATLKDMECTVGIEIRTGDDVDQATVDARDYAHRALCFGGGNHLGICLFVEVCIKEHYPEPDRAYFIETEEDGRGVQVFQPFGLPRGD